MKIQSEIKTFLVVTVIAIAISVGGILLLRGTTPESSPQTLDTSDFTLSEVEGWQTYRSDEFGFEVRYPPMLTFKFSSKESGFLYDWGEQKGDSFRIASSLHFGPEIYDFTVYSNRQNLSLDEYFSIKRRYNH